MDLSPWWPYIKEVANHRLENNKTQYHVAEFGDYIEVIGAAGELAARRFLGLSENLHKHFDGGADMLYRDIWVDVKATVWTPRLENRFLQWPLTKPVKADVILLTAVNMERRAAIVRGYALPHEIAQAPVNETRRFPCLEIPVPRLHNASRLLFTESLSDLYPSSQAQAHYRQNSYRPGAGA